MMEEEGELGVLEEVAAVLLKKGEVVVEASLGPQSAIAKKEKRKNKNTEFIREARVSTCINDTELDSIVQQGQKFDVPN